MKNVLNYFMKIVSKVEASICLFLVSIFVKTVSVLGAYEYPMPKTLNLNNDEETEL